jgi:hypothetical protein
MESSIFKNEDISIKKMKRIFTYRQRDSLLIYFINGPYFLSNCYFLVSLSLKKVRGGESFEDEFRGKKREIYRIFNRVL